MNRMAMMAVVALVGCVGEPGEPDVSERVQEAANEPTGDDGLETYMITPQGELLLGELLDRSPYTLPGKSYFSVRAIAAHLEPNRLRTPVLLKVVGAASLSVPGQPGNSRYFNDVIVTDGVREIQLGVAGGDANTTYYKLVTTTGIDLCGGGNAIPVAGEFLASGLHVFTPGRITFGCEDGVVRKCNEWGYDPGTKPDAHQACTRMARADYRADGTPHTRDGTLIRIGDSITGVNSQPSAIGFQGFTEWPPDPALYTYEAAWWPGALGAGCLGRRRWASLPPGDLPGLPDPRLHEDAKNCEDYDIDDLIRDGALLFNASRVNDAPLYHWYAVGGSDRVVTIMGHYAAVESRRAMPFGSEYPYDFDRIDGYLLRVIPGDVVNPLVELDQVRVFHRLATGDRVLAAIDDPDFNKPGFEATGPIEGFVYVQPREGTVPFQLYEGPGGDLLSTTPGRAPAGYMLKRTIGYVFAPQPAP
jgi:ADYC domain